MPATPRPVETTVLSTRNSGAAIARQKSDSLSEPDLNRIVVIRTGDFKEVTLKR
jgi:hypothetical protein